MNDVDKRVLLKGFKRWRSLIEFVAPECPCEIGAIAFRESTWNPKARKYDSQFHTDYISADTPNAHTARRRITATGYQEHKFATSWGLMQVMGIVALERGYVGEPEGLLMPQMSLLYGAMQVYWLWERHKNITDVIAAYNAGSPQMLPNGTYENQGYVDDVLAAVAVLENSMAEGRR